MKIAGKELSEETIKKACEAYGISFKKEFEPIEIHSGCFEVSTEGKNVRVSIGDDYPELGCLQKPFDTRKFIAALQAAIDFLENK